MRAIPQSACSDNANPTNIKGIVYYGSSASTPTTTGYSYTDACEDEDSSNLVPYISKTVSSAFWDKSETVSLGTSSGLFRWELNSSTLEIEWNSPTLMQIIDGATSFNTSANVIQLSEANEWAYVIVQSALPIPHPIHLHGHDFFLVSRGTGTYSASTATINLSNPPRRDVALLPASGYLVLAFQTDNPGAWLMHCHIGWHTAEGFALQFIERYSEIVATLNTTSIESGCSSWSTYATADAITTDDSGV